MPAELLEDPIDAIMLDEERLAQDIGSPVNGAAKRALAGPLHIYRRAKRTVDRGEPVPEEQFADDAPSGAAFALLRGTQQLRRVFRSGHENTAEGSVRVSDYGPGTRF
jgi:hypothetical protein